MNVKHKVTHQQFTVQDKGKAAGVNKKYKNLFSKIAGFLFFDLLDSLKKKLLVLFSSHTDKVFLIIHMINDKREMSELVGIR